MSECKQTQEMSDTPWKGRGLFEPVALSDEEIDAYMATDNPISAMLFAAGERGGWFEDLVKCRECGCDDMHACVSDDGIPCHWAEDDLCSGCA